MQTHTCVLASQVVLVVKDLCASAGDVRDSGSTPGSGRSLEEGMAPHSSILAWGIPWTEEPGRLQSMGPQGIGQEWSSLVHRHTYICPLFFRLFSHTDHHRALSRVPCATQWVLVGYLFYKQECVCVNLKLLIYSSPRPFPFGNHKFVFEVCEPVSVLLISLFVSFFFVRFRIWVMSHGICLSLSHFT